MVNTCAFIEAARQESIDTVLALSDARQAGARLVVTGCMAERYGDELADALPEVDLVAPFGASLTGRTGAARSTRGDPGRETGPSHSGTAPSFDLFNLPRPAAAAPWAYIKIAEGCDRNCGFCAIPSFRGNQRSRTDRVDSRRGRPAWPAQPTGWLRWCWSPRISRRSPSIAPVAGSAHPARRAGHGGQATDRRPGGRPWPNRSAGPASSISTRRRSTTALVETILATGVPYFDLSLQHVSRPLLKRMRRWGDGERFLDRSGVDPGIRADGRLPVLVHRRLSRARPRTTTTACSSG